MTGKQQHLDLPVIMAKGKRQKCGQLVIRANYLSNCHARHDNIPDALDIVHYAA